MTDSQQFRADGHAVICEERWVRGGRAASANSSTRAVSAILAGVSQWPPIRLAEALRAVWAADTCSPDDIERAGWSPANPAWGHCDVTALIVNDVYGGDLMLGEVWLDGEQHGYHWWNRLGDGSEIDLTREQFRLGQVIADARPVTRPPGRLQRRWDEYLLLRERLAGRLGPLPPPAKGTEPA